MMGEGRGVYSIREAERMIDKAKKGDAKSIHMLRVALSNAIAGCDDGKFVSLCGAVLQWRKRREKTEESETQEERGEAMSEASETTVRILNLLCEEGRCPQFYHKSDDNLSVMGIQCVQLSVYDGGERVHFYGDDAAGALRQCAERLRLEVSE